MKVTKKILIILLLFLSFSIVSLQNISFAATDQFKAFLSPDFSTDVESQSATRLACRAFQTLGYTNVLGTDSYQYNATKSSVLNYINSYGNNYGLYICSHGNMLEINLSKNNSAEYIYPSDISGNWHLVFIDSCSSMASNAFANAFKTTNYSNRASLEWYDTVTTHAAAQFFKFFHVLVGTTNLRSACLTASDRCTDYSPISMYGDTTWYGWAW